MKKNLLKIIISVVAIFIIGTFYVSLKKTEIYDTKNLVGTNLDNFELNSLNKNLKINQELVKKSQYTLINFWASWCAPCRAEHKYLINLKRNAKNLKLIGINFKDEKKNANKFLSEFGDPYHYSAADSEGKVSINFGVYGIPESILVNNDLKIIKKFIGPLNQDEYTSILNLTN
jgi:cytochrome c biogenesis protein CcmG/thiol:disulfide interchange protein DsbE|tara:strand:- start:757 stop:1278 length:522 start_codon:yes stop_codon:yes gene_type:complete